MAEPSLPGVDKLKLVRDGTEQGDRFPNPLDPMSVPVHGREEAHAMLFAREYAAFLKYYSSVNQPDQDWQTFFSKDVSVALAAAAVQDVNRYRSVMLTCFKALENLDNAGSPEVIKHTFGYIFGAVGTLARQLDLLNSLLSAEIALRATIGNLVRTRLAGQLKRLVAWFNADQTRLPADTRLIESVLIPPEPRDDYEMSILGVAPRAFGDLLVQDDPLSEDWLAGESWDDFRSAKVQPGVFDDPAGTLFERANAYATHNQFTGACDQFLKSYARIVNDAKSDLDRTLSDYDQHEPHYALFLAFLRMLEYSRADVNRLGGRHLDFYYRKVLQLAEQPATPCKAHVVVELGKHVASYELGAGSDFKAGKDAQKKLVVFTSDEALVANKSLVSQVRSLHRDTETGVIHVDPADKVEGESWDPFGNSAEVGSFGFSIASHYLSLGEGERKVTLKVQVGGYKGSTNVSLKDKFTCRFTTADGWHDIEPSRCKFASSTKPETTILEITVELDGDKPGITAYDFEKHASSYDVALPILEVRLNPIANHTAGMLSTFGELEGVFVQKIDLSVEVKGFRSLMLSTDLGPADASKPFQPFGPAPVVGSSLVVGCKEAFVKNKLDECKLSLTWRNWSNASTQATVLSLSKGQWSGSSAVEILNENPKQVILPGLRGTFNTADDASLVYPSPFSLEATSGYIKLSLQGTFGHETYAARVAQYVIDAVGGAESTARVARLGTPVMNVVMEEVLDVSYSAAAGITGGMPSEPYTPELEAITLDYTASQSIDFVSKEESSFNERKARFYHVTSFGLAEQHAFLRTESEEPGVSLLPLVSHCNALDPALAAGSRVPHQGEMYIGLAGVAAPQRVALLFQVEDGSADPLAAKPSPHLHFSYLRKGDWVAFTSDQIDDRTSELLESGIITISIPEDVTDQETLLPGGCTWIRIAVGEQPRAVCRLFDVMAQAVQVTFDDRENDPAFLAAPLAPGTITKLAVPVASIKSVTQPYESFGGRMQETPRAFHTRVSERLRHKNRAITLWDIERLVLAAFPGIHRVKCLNHTRYEPTDSGSGVYEELAAGHITVVTIPAVSEGYAADPLTPFTSLSVLEQVKAYLEERSSCFATLHLANPDYERLRVVCNVRLRGGSDESYSLSQLRASLTQFLAPWAFDATLRPSFGGRVYRSSLINLLEEQDCVDYVTDFRLYQQIGDAEVEKQTVAVGSRAVSVLASVQEDVHVITAIHETEESGQLEECGCSP